MSLKDSLDFSPNAKMKVLLIVEENSSKIQIKLFPLCTASYENKSWSQIICELFSLKTFF